MVVYTLEQRWEIFRHYFENRGNVAECVRKFRMDLGRRKAPSPPYVRYLVQKSKNHSVKSQKQCVHQRVFRRHHWDKFCINTLVWRNTKFNWFRSWSQLTIQRVFASLSGPAIDLQKMPILAKKKIIFSDEVHLTGYVKKQICRIWGTQNAHAYIKVAVV